MFDWTASKIDAANYCGMRFYLRYILHNQPLMLPVYSKGSLLHSSIEHFWDKLGKPDEIKQNKKGTVISEKKYSNGREFKKYLSGKWMSRAIGSENSERPINWQFEGEQFFIRSKLEQLAEPLFAYLSEQGPPLYAEFPFKFILGNRSFTGRVDEIRIENKKVLIRDYKSGMPWLDETKTKGDPQLTFYNAGLNILLKQDSDLREYFIERGADPKLLINEDGFINPNFQQEFFMIEALPRVSHPEDFPKMKTIPKIRLSAPRREAHFSELLKMIEGVFSSVSGGRVYPERGRKCKYCDMKHNCEKELDSSGVGYLTTKGGQFHLSFDIPSYRQPNNLTLDSKSFSKFGVASKPKSKEGNPEQITLKLRRKPVRTNN